MPLRLCAGEMAAAGDVVKGAFGCLRTIPGRTIPGQPTRSSTRSPDSQAAGSQDGHQTFLAGVAWNGCKLPTGQRKHMLPRQAGRRGLFGANPHNGTIHRL
jgi:hypothetical protein